VPASSNPSLPFASFNHPRTKFQADNACRNFTLKNVREIYFPDLKHCKKKGDGTLGRSFFSPFTSLKQEARWVGGLRDFGKG
jgi:hypothetical protein